MFSCEKDDSPEDEKKDKYLNEQESAVVASVDQISMVKYVTSNGSQCVLNHLFFTLEQGAPVNILFEKKDFSPTIGLKISGYSTYYYSVYDAYEISTEKGKISMESQLKYIKDNNLTKEPTEVPVVTKTGIVEECFFMDIREALVWDISDGTVEREENFFIRVDGVLYYFPLTVAQKKNVAYQTEAGDEVTFTTSSICKNLLEELKNPKAIE
ncbi:MAG: hypothetical protein ACK5N8_07485 [Alphaproteobacteria bacterium]